MPTSLQDLGNAGEALVVKRCGCPRCKRSRTLKRLPSNFKCADVICDFCGFLAQVKTSKSLDVQVVPDRLLGAAWGVQEERMRSGIYFPLFLVLMHSREHVIYYLSADLQHPEMFLPRKPLSERAKRAGWQGFMYNLKAVKNSGLVRVH